MADSNEIKMFRGEVSAVKHFSIDTGFLVFQIMLENEGRITRHTMSCAGTSDDPPPVGSLVEVYGSSQMTQWGPQIKYAAFHVLAGNSSVSLARYLKSFAKYLGDEKSMAIARYFGASLEDVIEKNPDRLLEVEGIGDTIKDNIVVGWKRNKSVHSIKMFLSSIGLSDSKIRQIVARHGPQYDSLIKEDPFVLMHEGIGFSVCDAIFEKLKGNPVDICRIRALVLDGVRKLTFMGEGHLFVERENIVRYANQLNDTFAYNRKIDTVAVVWDQLQPGLTNLLENAHLYEDEQGRIYPTNLYFFEAKSAELLAENIRTAGEAKFASQDPQDLVDYYEAHERISIPDFKFSSKQEEAIKAFVRSKVMIVTGPPGTGKTTIIKTFVRILDSNKVSYCLLAPTGAASKRLEQTSNKPASTIHRFLGFQGKSWGNHSNNQIDESVVIVDECSMVDMELFYRLVSATRPNAHLVFVGDVDQLPSVGPGNVLKDLIASDKVTTIKLDQVHRQASLSEIVLEANKIKDGDQDLSLFKSDINADICFVRTGRDVEAGEQSIIKVCKSLATNPKITFQILTPRNEGDLSVGSLNTLLQKELNPPGSTPSTGSVQQIHLDKNTVVRPGDRVIVIKNNYNLGVFNGDIGKVRLITSEVVRIDLNSGESVAIPISSAREMLKLAYAITVHKCLPSWSPVNTPDGYKTIEEVSEGSSVLNPLGEAVPVSLKTKVFHKTGQLLKSVSGRELLSSRQHRHILCRDGVLQEVPASDARPGDYLVISRVSEFGMEVPLLMKGWKTHNPVSLVAPEEFPRTLTEDMAWVLGVLVGDGSLTDETDGLVYLNKSSSTSLIDEYSRVVRSFGIPVHKHKGKGYGVYTSSVAYRAALLGYGLGFHKSTDKVIPTSIWGATRKVRLSFLAGLLDTDGSISGRSASFRFASSSLTLVHEVQDLLMGLGYPSKVGELHQNYRGSRYTSFCVRVGGTSYNKLSSEVPLRNPKRVQVKKANRDIFDVVPISSEFLSTLLQDIRVQQGTYGKRSKYRSLSFRSISDAITCGKHTVTYSWVNKLIETLKGEGFKIPDSLEGISKKHFFFDKIVSSKEVDTSNEVFFDVEVGGNHTFMTRNIVTHNSQGSEYSVVILPLLKSHGGMLLQRNLLYTAMTRARKKVVVVGQESAIESAISNASIKNRNTAFAQRIIKCLEAPIGSAAFFTAPFHKIPESAENYYQVQKLLNPSKPEKTWALESDDYIE